VTETFANLLARGGATSRSFEVRDAGDVTMTLTTLGVSDVEVGIAIGRNEGEIRRLFARFHRSHVGGGGSHDLPPVRARQVMRDRLRHRPTPDLDELCGTVEHQ
jgi:hypothetical protein